jgi:hypothetical protein
VIRDEWLVIAGWVDEWWPAKFESSAEDAWFVALEGFEAQDVIESLRAMLARGGTFRPSVAEVIGQIRRDPAVPTAAEMITLIFGRGGVLSARTQIRKGSWEAGERDQADRDAMRERLADMHPVVASFVDREGLDRLRALNLEDAEFGGARRRMLEQRWGEHLEAVESREVAVLTSGRRGEMAKLDPLAALHVRRPVAALNGGER